MPVYPIKSVGVNNFGPFANARLDFSPRINVIVGDNGTGKSQLLKLLYSCAASLSESSESQPKSQLNRNIASKLVGVFRPDTLGRLTNRARGRARADISLKFSGISDPLRFSFASNSRAEVNVETRPTTRLVDTPVFLPAHELMSFYPGFVSLYNERVIEMDETWRDTADLLGRAPLRGPRSQLAAKVLEPVEEILEGRVNELKGRFVLARPGQGNFEMPLVAEGLRKIAMIVRLVQSGVLLEGGYLFWDEPEANLNPKAMRKVVNVIVELAQMGVQVFVATHSTYLMRELELAHVGLSDIDSPPFMKAIGLLRGDAGVVATQGTSFDDLPLEYLASLQAEVSQSERILAE